MSLTADDLKAIGNLLNPRFRAIEQNLEIQGKFVGDLARDVGELKRQMLAVHTELRGIKQTMRDGDEWKGGGG